MPLCFSVISTFVLSSTSNMDSTNDIVDAEIGMDDAKDKHAGQLAHRFVHNFHVHEGDQTRCSTCGDEKVCLRCSHVGKKECDVCGMWMNRRDFVRHRRIHTGERPYQCKDCAESFKLKIHLVQHRRIHAGEKPFLCEKCGHQFRNLSNLRDHQASTHSTAREHQSEECDKSYKLRGNLMRHMRRVHDRVYTCRQCNEVLPTRNAYTEHCLTHSSNAKQAEEETEDVKHAESTEESENMLE